MNIHCPSCRTDHDVSGRPAGTLVTCHCGETFGFPRMTPARSSLQCPGCGAAADPADQRCQYCDKLLHSVCCSNCYTPMFDGSRHCSECGTRVVTPALAVHSDGGTALPCPKCSVGLTANLVGNQLFDRCDQCGGIWAHHAAIDGLLARRPARTTVQEWLQALPPPAGSTAVASAAMRCPDCEQTMQRHSTPSDKNIVIDACGIHGIWFDHREIRAIVGEQPDDRRRKGRSRRHDYGRIRNRTKFAPFLDDTGDWWPWGALEELFDFLEDLFD